LALSAAALIAIAGVVLANEAAPANTLMDIRAAVSACLSHTPTAAGSRVTIMFMMKRDGSIFGRPRISYAHLDGDVDTRRRFVDEAERAVSSCLPVKVTPALGAAIAGRMFTITLGRERPEI
jgi:hypothetical protein